MFYQLNFALVIFMLMSIQTFCKPLESTDEQLSEIEKDLASVLTDDPKQKFDDDKIPSSPLKELDESQESDKYAVLKDEDKIPQSLLDDLKPRSKNDQKPSPYDKSVLQGFVPTTNDKSNADDLLSDEEVMQKQKRLFKILTETEKDSQDNSKFPKDISSEDSQDNSKFPKDISSEKLKDDNKIPDDLLRDLEEPSENNEVKKEILTAVVEDEIIKKIQEKVKRRERIPDKVIDLLRKYNTKRSN